MPNLDAYFRRIGYTGPRTPTLATLRALQALHPLAIPFENLDTVAGAPVRLDLAALQSKLVGSSRGGYCFEQNSLFHHVLVSLGFEVARLAARVVWERPADEIRARTHMLLRVRLGADDYLCDVGFGGLTPTAPLRFAPHVAQATPHESFRIVPHGVDLAVEAQVRGEWKPLYRFDLQEQHAVDIEMLNFYVMGHPDSPMLGRLVAASTKPDRRLGLRNGSLAVHHRSGAEERRQLGSVAELRTVLETEFGIAVPRGAVLEAALARLLD